MIFFRASQLKILGTLHRAFIVLPSACLISEPRIVMELLTIAITVPALYLSESQSFFLRFCLDDIKTLTKCIVLQFCLAVPVSGNTQFLPALQPSPCFYSCPCPDSPARFREKFQSLQGFEANAAETESSNSFLIIGYAFSSITRPFFPGFRSRIACSRLV